MASRLRVMSCGLLLVALAIEPAAAQQTPAEAGRTSPPGLVTVPRAIDRAAARVYLVEDFRRLPPDRRRATMQAWAAGEPEAAGPALLGMIVEGLRDADPGVRILSAGVVQRIVLATNLARVRSTAVRTPLHAMPPLYESLIAMVGDPLPQVRREALGALRGFHFPPDPTLEAVVLARVHRESDTAVRAVMIAVLGDFAVRGSKRAVDVIADAFVDPSPDVRRAAVFAAGMLPPAGWTDRVATLLSAREWWLRLAAAQALRRYKEAGAILVLDLESYLVGESDPRVKAALEHLIADSPASRER